MKFLETYEGRFLNIKNIICIDLDDSEIFCIDSNDTKHVISALNYDTFLDSELNDVKFTDKLKGDITKKYAFCIANFAKDERMSVIFDYDDLEAYAWKIFLMDYEKSKQENHFE